MQSGNSLHQAEVQRPTISGESSALQFSSTLEQSRVKTSPTSRPRYRSLCSLSLCILAFWAIAKSASGLLYVLQAPATVREYDATAGAAINGTEAGSVMTVNGTATVRFPNPFSQIPTVICTLLPIVPNVVVTPTSQSTTGFVVNAVDTSTGLPANVMVFWVASDGTGGQLDWPVPDLRSLSVRFTQQIPQFRQLRSLKKLANFFVGRLVENDIPMANRKEKQRSYQSHDFIGQHSQLITS